MLSTEDIMEKINSLDGRELHMLNRFEDKNEVNALDTASDKQRLEIIIEEVEKMPKLYKDAMMAFINNGYLLKYGEVAKILNIKIGTVRSRLGRGRIMLRKKLEKRFKKDPF